MTTIDVQLAVSTDDRCTYYSLRGNENDVSFDDN